MCRMWQSERESKVFVENKEQISKELCKQEDIYFVIFDRQSVIAYMRIRSRKGRIVLM